MTEQEMYLMEEKNRDVKYDFGTGRLFVPDDRDKRFSVRKTLDEAEDTRQYKERSKTWWSDGWYGNQGKTSHCVGYSWAHWLDAGPIRQPFLKEQTDEGYPINPLEIYNNAQRMDQWPGEDYEGTAVRAGAKYLKQRGLIKEYRWAWDVDTVIETLMRMGPMVVGTWWYTKMYSPDRRGIIEPSGKRDGGHAYLLTGVDLDMEVFKIKNSWGRAWGRGGYAYIDIADFESLIQQDGECCIAIEKEKKG